MSLLQASRAELPLPGEAVETAPRTGTGTPAPVEERLEVPRAPTVTSAISAAVSGFYFNSMRLVPANVIWGALLLFIAAVVFAFLPIALLLFVVILPIPTAVMFRLAALIQRGEPVSLGDALAWRSVARRGIGAGLLIGTVSLVLIYNMVVGFASASTFGWAFGTSAFWGLIVLWFIAGSLWPLLFDPLRADEPIRELVKLAAVIILVKPGRYALLMLVVGGVLFVSTVLVVAIVTISMAFVALVLAAYALPAADRIEGRPTLTVVS